MWLSCISFYSMRVQPNSNELRYLFDKNITILFEMKKSILITLSIILYALSACKKPVCNPPGSDELWIVIEDSLGNNIIEQDYPNLILELSDNLSSHTVNSTSVSTGTITQKAWKFNVDEMISGYPYIIAYDSLNIDTLTVDWFLNSSECNGSTFYFRSITSVTYNNIAFVNGGLHTVIK
ncbi:MAG: hypothetical protein ACI837_002457 [Crocinitomicaceae bacterium]|jgi:hypothetical protein